MPRLQRALALILAFVVPPALAVEPGEEGISRVLASGEVDPPRIAPSRGDEARGPFPRLTLANAMLVDGTGAPPNGPVTLTIEHDTITRIARSRPEDLDAEG